MREHGDSDDLAGGRGGSIPMLVETSLPDLPAVQRASATRPAARDGASRGLTRPSTSASAVEGDATRAAIGASELRSLYLRAKPGETLMTMPWAASALDAGSYTSLGDADSCARAAVLAAAILDLKRRIEDERPVLQPREDSRTVDAAHTQRFYDALLGSVVIADEDGRAALRTTEGATHFVVSCGTSFYEVPGHAADGRPLTSAELLPMIQRARSEALSSAPSTRIPIERLSRFPRASLYRLEREMDAACLVNGRTLRTLNRALFHIVLADGAMEPPSEPALGLDGAATTAQWLAAGATVLVYPTGAALLRTNALFCPSASLAACAAWVANAAAGDPMIAPPAARPTVIKGVKKSCAPPTSPTAPVPGSRAQTPASPAKKGKAAPTPAVEERPPEEEVEVTVKPPAVPTEPRRCAAWMPEGFRLPPECRPSVALPRPVQLQSVVAAAADEASVALAILLAADSLDLATHGVEATDAGDAPPPTLFCSRGTSEPCELRVRLCRDSSIDSAVAHLALLVAETGTRCGPLASSVAAACATAHSGIAAAIAGPAFVSYAGGKVGHPTVVGVAAPYSPFLQWSIESTHWPPTAPAVSFVPVSRHRRSLGRLQTGRLFSCTVMGDARDAAGNAVPAARLAATIKDFVVVVQGLLRQMSV